MLVVGPESMLGTSAMVKITSVGRWSVFGEVIQILTENVASPVNHDDKYLTCSNLNETCCSKESETCACGLTSSCGQTEVNTIPATPNDQKPGESRRQDLNGSLLRRRTNDSQGNNENGVLELDEKKEMSEGLHEWVLLDKAALFGIFTSLLTIISIFFYLGSKDFSSK